MSFNVRQGQTIYTIDYHMDTFGKPPTVEAYFLHSHKEPLPPLGCKILRMPVTLMRDILNRPFCGPFYLSRRKALSALARIL